MILSFWKKFIDMNYIKYNNLRYIILFLLHLAYNLRYIELTRNGSTEGNSISGIPTFKYGRR